MVIKVGMITCWYKNISMANYSQGLVANLRLNPNVCVDIVTSHCVCSSKYVGLKENLENGNCRFINFPQYLPTYKSGRINSIFTRSLQAVLNLFRGAIFLSACKNYDIAHFQQSSSFSFGIFSLVPIILIPTANKKIVTVHNLDTSFGPRTQGVVAKLIYNRADAIIVHSKALKFQLVAMGVKPSQVKIIPHGVTISTITSTERNEITFFGAPTERKGAFVLLKALKILKDTSQKTTVHFYGICSISQKVAFTKNAIELGVNDCIIWGGRLSEQDFDLKMQNSMFTFAVYTAPVSGSNIITRAMANATPVIATNIGVAPEYRGDFLFLIPSDDSEALALAISKLEKNPTMRANMSNSARRQSYRYSWETISDMNLAVYLDVLKKT